jgi:phospholipid/cholesterol/gamma-HCH transport system substrate-binding protein
LKLTDEFKVGILATVTLIILIFGYNFLKGNNPFNKNQTFYVVYEKISQLNPSDPVLVNGFKVGKVKSMNKMPDIRKGIVVELMVNSDVQLPKNSHAKIISVDLMGAKAIELVLSDKEDFAQTGDTLPSDIQLSLTEEVKMEVLPVKQKATELMGSLDTLVQVIQGILDKGQIESSMNSIEKATEQFADVAKNMDSIVINESKAIHNILANIEAITSNLKDNDENIDKLLLNLGAVTDSINKANLPLLVDNLNHTLKELKTTMETINKGEGTAGLLLKERTTYDMINKTIEDLDKLFLDLQQNPKRYVHFSVFSKDPDKKKK